MARASWRNASHQFAEALLDCSEELTKTGRGVMRKACEDWLEKTDADWPRGHGDYWHPWYSGALHDSLVARISEDGQTLFLRYMPSRSDEIQTATAEETGTRSFNRIVGAAAGLAIARTAEMTPYSGTVAEMLIGVPYAEFVNEMASHEGYIEELETDFVDYIQEQFDKNNTLFKNLLVRPRR